MLRLLVIGNLPPPLGGATVSLNHLITTLQKLEDVDVQVVGTGGNRKRKLRSLFAFMNTCLSLALRIPTVDVVSLHCSTPGLPFKGAVALLLARLFRKPLVIRKFAGTDYRSFGYIHGMIAERVLQAANLYLAQTKQLVEQAESRGIGHVRWFPTHRPVQAVAQQVSERCSRFVYVGHVREGKGLETLVAASQHLDETITVDVYGPWFGDLDKSLFDNCKDVNYRGQLEPDAVAPTMREYDAFVFPTHHSGEGYPGVIIEALAAGLPVVASDWMAISEIIDDSVGILVPPKSPKHLADAMLRLHNDSRRYSAMQKSTSKRAEFFSVERWAREFVRFCRESTSEEC